jgi:NodT family efflux transporter outer membrane factor (OMF) lipoprotein
MKVMVTGATGIVVERRRISLQMNAGRAVSAMVRPAKQWHVIDKCEASANRPDPFSAGERDGRVPRGRRDDQRPHGNRRSEGRMARWRKQQLIMTLRAFRQAACAATFALVSGCASMGNLAPHSTLGAAADLGTDETFAQAELSEAGWPAADWWKRFDDPQLDWLEAEAVAGSPTLKAAQARVDQARAVAGATRSARLPQIDAALQSTRQRHSENDAAPPLVGSWQTANRFTLNFGYEFDFWGKNRAAFASATSKVQAAKVDAFAARLMLSVAVARNYVQLARAYDQLDIARATLEQRQQIYDLTRKRVSAGLDSRVELKQAEAALPATRETIAALTETMALTRNQIAALLGEGPDRGLAIARPNLVAVTAAATLPSRLPANLLGRRPDVVASRWRVEAAAKNIKVAKAQFYPDIDLLGFVGFQSLGLSRFLHAGSRTAGIGPALRLPIFEGGRLRSRLAGADANYDVAVEQYNQTLADALRDFGDRLAKIRSVASQRRQQGIALAATQDAYRLAVLRYREGVGNYLSVLSAQAQDLAQQRLETDLLARAFINRIELARALGGGFDSHAPVRSDRLGVVVHNIHHLSK